MNLDPDLALPGAATRIHRVREPVSSVCPRSAWADDPLAGTGYRSLKVLGQGGMGEVHEAVHLGTGVAAAVKVLRPEFVDQPSFVERMRMEGEVLAAVGHPNVVRALGSGRTANDQPFVVLEYLVGTTLRDLVGRRGPLPPVEVAAVVRQLLSALAAVHEAGFVHRDVKPENVMLCRVGRRQVVKLIDFGVVKVLPKAGRLATEAMSTAPGFYVGTPRYAAPEQVRGGPIDPRTDLYQVGVVLYFLLAGRGPFDDAQGPGSVLRAHVERRPAPPSRLSRNPLGADLDRIVVRALSKEPDERYQDARSFSRDLALFLGRHCLPLDAVLRAAREGAAPRRSARPSHPRRPVGSARGPRRPLTVSRLPVFMSAAGFALLAILGALAFIR